MRVVGIIPARFASTRLPGKPLMDIQGKSMIQRVYENADRSATLEQLIVATDDRRIAEAVERFGGRVQLTSNGLNTGTDRVAEVVRLMEVEVVVNIQGDEPFMDPRMIDEIVHPLLDDSNLPMCTLTHELKHNEDLHDPNVVKTVTDLAGNALYFSRSLIPYPRRQDGYRVLEHIGLYAYRKDFLLTLAGLPQTPLEKAESLEQLRVLEYGYRIRVVQTQYDYAALNVDTAEDLERARVFASKLR
jgi:3-deoxy-manno-octulosonate cytidylyltransferase (CMP-KDO synthetase)